MPERWIGRTFEPYLTAPPAGLQLFPVWLVLGPRQVGKSSLLTHCAPERQYINLDDLATRARANADPVLFARELRPPLIIDEIQYAPELLSPVKQLADASGQPGVIWLTGSQSFQVMRGVRETLAGRVAILRLLGLSDEEKRLAADDRTPPAYFEALVRTGFPKLWPVADPDARDLYLSSYTHTYIERDVREVLQVDKRREFELFLRLCALRTGCIVNFDELGRDAGVSAATVKSWLSVLEDSFLIKLIQPEHRNRSKRLIKSPKLYFLDVGLAAFLAGWKSGELLRLGPMGGAAFETHVLSEILKRFRHRAREVEVRFWRTRDGQEIDLLVEARGRVHPIEVKLGLPAARALPRLGAIAAPSWTTGHVVTLAISTGQALSEEWRAIPPWELDFLQDA
ncbi:MAG: ATP-binding protein [Deltaproteobacteria bacterium]|nr:ATP-binding protein [Deltaproteobacteria bacterium]